MTARVYDEHTYYFGVLNLNGITVSDMKVSLGAKKENTEGRFCYYLARMINKMYSFIISLNFKKLLYTMMVNNSIIK